jgi:uncharacterized membrane protein YdfJ with MMPL/SSD domain
MRQAVREVVATLRALPKSAADIESPLTSSGLTSGKSALVTFNVAGKPANDDQAVVPALNAVAKVQAHHPGLKVEEAGGASVDRAISNSTGNDFRKAEITSVPVSLVLLLVVFGALIAAGIPLLTSCEQGVCGTCLTGVLAGEPEHRDLYLTPEEQAANDQFTPCCSRARSERLVLDLG